MPIATPAAPYASAATRPRPSKNPPAAITGMSTASTTWGSSSVVGDRAGVAAALAALHDHRVDAPRRDLLGVTARADRRHDARSPASFSVLICCSRGASANDATRHALADRAGRRARRRPRRRRAGSRRTAGRCAPSLRGSRPRAGRSVIVADARMPSAPALRGRADEPGAGDPSHAGLHDRHVDAEQIADRRACRRASRVRDFLLAEAVRVDHLADPAQLVVGRQARSRGRRRRSTSSKPVAATTSSTVTPGWTRSAAACGDRPARPRRERSAESVSARP